MSPQKNSVTAVLDVRPMLRGSEKAVVEARLRQLPGVLEVEANPVSQTANVTIVLWSPIGRDGRSPGVAKNSRRADGPRYWWRSTAGPPD